MHFKPVSENPAAGKVTAGRTLPSCTRICSKCKASPPIAPQSDVGNGKGKLKSYRVLVSRQVLYS